MTTALAQGRSGPWQIMPLRTLLLAAGLAVTSVGAQAAPAATTAMPQPALPQPYVFPFADRESWLAFVGGTPDGKAAAAHYRQLYSAADFSRYRAGATTRTSRITYSSDGNLVKAIVVEPTSPGPHPVIIFNHGGVMQWGRIILAEILEFNRLAERGYVVMASTYRGEGGSGGQPDMDGGDVTDTLALLAIADTMPNVDPKRIGMWGFSRGGLVTYAALARTDRLSAAIIVGGPTDLASAPRRAEFDEFIYPYVIHDYARDKDAALNRLSPLNWPERLSARTPILILHGGDDPRVTTSDSLRMALKLQGLKRSYRLKIYEGGSHDLVENGLDVRTEMDRWWDLYLRDSKPAPANGVAVLPASEQ